MNELEQAKRCTKVPKSEAKNMVSDKSLANLPHAVLSPTGRPEYLRMPSLDAVMLNKTSVADKSVANRKAGESAPILTPSWE